MKRIIYTLALIFAPLQTFAQTYTYDSNNRLTSVVYNNGVTVTYSYDALGNRTSKRVTGASATTYTITVTVSPVGSGIVTGGGTYNSGTTIELYAEPHEGYEFLKWSDGVTDNPRTVTVTQNKSYTALFTENASPSDNWYLVAHNVNGSTKDIAMDLVGSLVAVDDASDFSVLDVNGNILATRVLKVTFRQGPADDAVEKVEKRSNIIGGVVNGKLTIIGVKGLVTVYDMSGVRHIQVEAKDDETTIDVSNLPTGIYVVRVGQQSFKFIKK